MDKVKVEVTKPPVSWQERIEQVLLEDMPDAPYFASWVAENINWQYPVVNPWDYSKRYRLRKVAFHPSWAGVLASMAAAHQKLVDENPADPDLWYPHKDQFEGLRDKDMRDFYSMKHLGLIRACPPEIADKQPDVVHPVTGRRKKGHSGRFQPTDEGLAFLANMLSVPNHMIVFRNKLVGLSGYYVNVARVLFEWQDFEYEALYEAPEHTLNPVCQACGRASVPFFLSSQGDVLCRGCAPAVRDRFYNDLIAPFKEAIKEMRGQGGYATLGRRLSDNWKSTYEEPYYQPTWLGVTEDVVIDLDIGAKGAVALPERTLRSFLNRREKRRRQLAELRVQKEDTTDAA